MKNRARIGIDLVYSISALFIMNSVIQFIVYPYINKKFGGAEFGNIVYILGLIAIVAPSIGASANNIRVLINSKDKVENGDFNYYIIISTLLLGIFLFIFNIDKINSVFLFFSLLIFSTYRYYSDVESRITLNYKKYFIYYLCISIGFVFGSISLRFYNNWWLSLIMGEAFGFIFVLLTGNLFRPFFKKSKTINKVIRMNITLSSSYLLYNFILNADRIILLKVFNSTVVAQYYVVSLLGKSVAMIVSSVKSIIIGYLAKREERLHVKEFSKIVLLVLLLSVVFFVICLILTPFFIRWRYPEYLSVSFQLIFIATLSQIVCFSSDLILTVVLTVSSTKWQLFIQMIYVILFFGCSIIGAYHFGLIGFSTGTLI